MNDQEKLLQLILALALAGGAHVEVVRKAPKDMKPEECDTCPHRDECDERQVAVDTKISEEDRAAFRRMGIKA